MGWLRDVLVGGVRSGEQELPVPYEGLAARLVDLRVACTAEVPFLNAQQQLRSRDKAYLDTLIGKKCQEEYLRNMVEIRAIGHRLNREGGFELMVSVADRVGVLSRDISVLRAIESDWDRIGDWLG